MKQVIDNNKNKVMIKVPYNNNEYYSYCWDGLYTNSGKPVKILETDVDFYKNGENNIIGLVEDYDKHEFCVWDKKGKNFNPDKDIYMIRYETPNYDHITKKDIPDTDEFRDNYERNQQYSFKMSPLEYLRYKEFCKDHSNCCKNTCAIGGGIVVSFIGTGLGNIVHAKCECCGLEVDLTDNECW